MLSVTVNTDTSPLAANATTLVINGSGFDPIVDQNTVQFNDGAAGTVITASATQLIVEFTTNPTTAGALTAVVAVDSPGNTSSSTTVATVTPTVTSSTANLAANASTLIINGLGFDTNTTNDTVAFTDGATGHVTAASATQLTVALDTDPTTAGTLNATVTTNSAGSAQTQVATVMPAITSSTADLTADTATLTINGFGFDASGTNTVAFNNGVSGTVTNATATALTVTFAAAPTAGDLTAVVTTDNISSGAVQVATVSPVVTSSTNNLGANATTLTISGVGFDPVAANNSVALSSGAGTVTGATATSLTVRLTSAPSVGSLTALVTTDSTQGDSSVQVATVIPVVTSSTASLAANASTLIINGFGFDTNTANDTVALTDGAAGHVTAATATRLTVALDTDPTTAGALTATVTVGSTDSAATQVATVIPAITSSTADLTADTATLTINGFGFDASGTNTVAFNNGVSGTVTNATATALTVTFAAAPTAGDLTAVVTTDNISSGAVQVATVSPVVTSSTNNLGANATTLTISGVGFDPVAANNSVALSSGTGTVTAATATSLTLTFSAPPTTLGSLTAQVTTNGVASDTSPQVATVIPVVTSSTASLAFTASTLVINGYGFDTTIAQDSVNFDDGVMGTVTGATANALTVTIGNGPTTVGTLNASVTIDGVSSGGAVQVATVTPVVRANAANILTASSSSITIIGAGFDTSGTNVVSFSDGAIGTVQNVTATTITVNFTTNPVTAGGLYAVVTTDGVGSGTAQPVATVRPVATPNTTNLAANATTLTISGSGFDPIPGHNTVTFNDGAAGTVTASTPTSLTVTFSTKPTSAGKLTAVVTNNHAGSGAPVQVATVTPVVTSSTTALAANASTLTISGLGFDPTAGNNSVVFTDGAVGTVTQASTTSLTVTFTTNPTTAGSLTATVTSNGVSSSSAQVATVTPVVLANSALQLAADASGVIINGFGFDPNAANDSVSFNNGLTGTIAHATATSLTVTFGTAPTAGSLTATVTTDSQTSGAPVQVATIAPVVTASAANLPANATTLVIDGVGFDPTAGNNAVAFTDGAAGSVQSATATTLTVTLTSPPTAVGNLTAVVTTNGVNSGAPVQVATVTPAVTSSTAPLAANASSLVIDGFDFDPVAGNDSVQLTDGAIGSITSATSTALNVTLLTPPTTAGTLTAVVTTDGISSGAPVQVAAVAPVVTLSTASLAANATTLTINGIGFDTNAAHDTVTFNNGAAGTVQSAAATSLTVSIDTPPTTVGSLTATVTTNSVPSSAPVQVATVTPVVTSSAAALPFNATTLTINGFGFDATTPSNNAVSFTDGVVGTVTAATATSLTVSLSTGPNAVGNLMASVTTDNVSSGTAVQVATIVPVVTSNTATQDFDVTSVVIDGFGFDATASNNSVTLNDGAVGMVTDATTTSLTVAFFSNPTIAGNLTASVSTNGVSSGTPVEVAAIMPTVTVSTTSMAANAGSLTIDGLGFDLQASNDSVSFSNGAVGTVQSATATTLTVTLSTPPTAGNLTAIVTTNGISSSSAVQVATVTPVVTSHTAALPFNATTITINGFGFDATTPSNNTVTFTDGVVGTVTGATTTSLTVTLGTGPNAVGSLTASVTTDGQSSGPAVQVATVTPVVTGSTDDLAANGGTLTINGFGFDTTPDNNTVTLSSGAGVVTGATATSLTVIFTTPPIAGNLTASVTTDLVSSATEQVATVTPDVSSDTDNLAANAPSLTIHGVGFDPNAANDAVVLSSGTVGTITSASTTALTVTLATAPTAGNLTATVATNGVENGSNVQVATVTPVVTSSTANLALNGTTLVITGVGFDPTASNNTVQFNNNAAGTVTGATPTALTVHITTPPSAVGSLTAVVTTDSVPSPAPVQVAQAVAAITAPVVTTSTPRVAANANSVTVFGRGFNTTAGNNRVTFNNGAVGTVTAATATTLTVTFSTKPAMAGSLTAVVTTEGVGSGNAAQVATIMPVVTGNNATLAANATSLTINGVGFDPNPAHDTVTFNDGAKGTVTAATATSLTVSIATKPGTAGSLTAVVVSDAVASGTAVQVATVTPVVTSTTTTLAVNGPTLVISGFGFDPFAAHNVVTLSDGAVGTVTAASATSLTVSLSTKPTALGAIAAAVTTDTHSSGSPVQVATVRPVVTSKTTNLAANATTITINGFGFDTNAANDSVTFSGAAIGTVTAATATSLTVMFTTAPTAGKLTAVVTIDNVASAAAVQVATITPVVTSNTAQLARTAATIIINGFGFDPIAAHNTVVFSDGAIGTVTNATATALTVTFSVKPRFVGNLTAVVTTNGVSSGSAVQVATMV